MLRVATEMRELERRLAVPSVTVVRDREVSNNELKVFVCCIYYVLGSLSEKKRDFLGVFPIRGGEALPKSQNFCNLTK